MKPRRSNAKEHRHQNKEDEQSFWERKDKGEDETQMAWALLNLTADLINVFINMNDWLAG